MTVCDCIAQLERLSKQFGHMTQVYLGSAFNSKENPFDSFDIVKPLDRDEIYLIPSDKWIRSDLKSLAQREQQ